MNKEENEYFPYVVQIAKALARYFGQPMLGNKKNPFNELLYIILSSRTPPEVYQETYRSLRREFRRADSIAETRPEYVATTIERGGLQNKKARTITKIASELKNRFGRVTLAHLKDMETEDAEKFLVSLPGVGIKTARCVLMYSLDRLVFPVDAHCYRIAQQLKWIPQDIPLTECLADEIQSGVPEYLRRDLHVGMVMLGRNYCLPRSPLHQKCPILEFCPTGRTSVENVSCPKSSNQEPQ
ncbi:MAG TPA: hypothetical protein ENN19_04545 [Chloroflexi bacterium]|nr:hypothetical protein [Chloroflexota bacterium]